MADNNSHDPSKAFQEMVTQWERNFDAFANQFMGTEGFSQAMNEFQKAQLNLQSMFANAMNQQLLAFNMPTREDIVRLGENIQRLERRMDGIESGLEELTSKANKKRKPKKAKPNRSRQPPAEYEAPQTQAEKTDE